MITATQAQAQIVVRRRLTWLPMIPALLVSTTSGTRANGMPKDRTTWLRTRAPVVLAPDGQDDQRGEHGDRAPGEQRDAEAGEARHDDLAGVGADAGGGEPGGEQRPGERERRDAAEPAGRVQRGPRRWWPDPGLAPGCGKRGRQQRASPCSPGRPGRARSARRAARTCSTRLRSRSSRQGVRDLVRAECR